MSNDTLNPTSGIGKVHIDLAAPGVGILSTIQGNDYSAAGFSGTSMSAAQVSGAAALMFSAAGSDFMSFYASDPAAATIAIKDMILQSVELLPGMDTTTASGGRLDLYGALVAMLAFTGIKEQRRTETSIYPNPASRVLTIKLEKIEVGRLTILDILGRTHWSGQWNGRNGKVNIEDLQNGVYILRLETNSVIYRWKFAKFSE